MLDSAHDLFSSVLSSASTVDARASHLTESGRQQDAAARGPEASSFDKEADDLPRGGAVAELEFPEQVGAVHAKTFEVEGSATIVIVVMLQTHAVVVELAEPSTSTSAAPGWSIGQRLVVPVAEGQLPLAAISNAPGRAAHAVIALPGRQHGHVQIVHLPLSKNRKTVAAGPSAIFVAHTSPLSSIALSSCGSLLATTSEKGTLLRICSILGGSDRSARKPGEGPSTNRTPLGTALVRELRRGLDTAKIHDVRFSPDARFIAAASETGSIRFFSLEARPSQASSALSSGRNGSGREQSRPRRSRCAASARLRRW